MEHSREVVSQVDESGLSVISLATLQGKAVMQPHNLSLSFSL